MRASLVNSTRLEHLVNCEERLEGTLHVQPGEGSGETHCSRPVLANKMGRDSKSDSNSTTPQLSVPAPRRAHLSRPVGQSDEVPLGGPRHDDHLLRQLLLPDLPEGGHGCSLRSPGTAASRPPLPASGGAASCSGAERNKAR